MTFLTWWRHNTKKSKLRSCLQLSSSARFFSFFLLSFLPHTPSFLVNLPPPFFLATFPLLLFFKALPPCPPETTFQPVAFKTSMPLLAQSYVLLQSCSVAIWTLARTLRCDAMPLVVLELFKAVSNILRDNTNDTSSNMRFVP